MWSVAVDGLAQARAVRSLGDADRRQLVDAVERHHDDARGDDGDDVRDEEQKSAERFADREEQTQVFGLIEWTQNVPMHW